MYLAIVFVMPEMYSKSDAEAVFKSTPTLFTQSSRNTGTAMGKALAAAMGNMALETGEGNASASSKKEEGVTTVSTLERKIKDKKKIASERKTPGGRWLHPAGFPLPECAKIPHIAQRLSDQAWLPSKAVSCL